MTLIWSNLYQSYCLLQPLDRISGMARIPDDELERLKRETDLVALV